MSDQHFLAFLFFCHLIAVELPKNKGELLSNNVPTLLFPHTSVSGTGSSPAASSVLSPSSASGSQPSASFPSHHANVHSFASHSLSSRPNDPHSRTLDAHAGSNIAAGRPVEDTNQQPLILLCGLLVATLLVVFSLLMLLLWKQRKRSHKPNKMCGKGNAFLQLDALHPDDHHLQQQQMLLLMQPNTLNGNAGGLGGGGGGNITNGTNGSTSLQTNGQQILINHNSRGYLQQPNTGTMIGQPDLLRNNNTTTDKMQLLARINQGGNLIDHLLIRTLDSNGSNGSSCGGISALCPTFVNNTGGGHGSTLTSNNGWTGRASAMHQMSSRSSGTGSLGSSRGGAAGGTNSDDDQRLPAAAHWVGAHHASNRRHRRRPMRPIRLSTEEEEDEPDYAEPIISTPVHSDSSAVYDQCDEYGTIGSIAKGNYQHRSNATDTPPTEPLTGNSFSHQHLMSLGKHNFSSAAPGPESSLDSNDTSPSYASYDSVTGRPPLPRSLPPAPRGMPNSMSGQMVSFHNHSSSNDGYRTQSSSFESSTRKAQATATSADRDSMLTISS